ncbi:OsmC family protein [Streptomyces marincola]|uniref:OsmC family protein n=1 Tax=Streptomyces marincola TaxID=2878388 RepID=UPI001CF17E63|nr:OsmC family protein [Streptomyces marincola]UCM88482.1 OsmC family protein [Streptomyces marincola]
MSRTREHTYDVTVTWTGNTGAGTAGYRDYARDIDTSAPGKATRLPASADPFFLGDAERWNPEDLLVAALAQCHMLSYLAACSLKKVVVTAYEDTARGTMAEAAGVGGGFTGVVLRPVVTVADASMVEAATALHEDAHRKCFIANSVNFPVRHEPEIRVAGD